MQEDTGARNKQEIVGYLLKLVATDPANMEPTTVDLLPTIERKNLRRLRTIGEGAFGEVAEVEWLGQQAAQKIFKGLDSRNFLLEANILAGLCHPNIVQILGVGAGGRQCSIAMELLHGDLRRAINDAFYTKARLHHTIRNRVSRFLLHWTSCYKSLRRCNICTEKR
jgi:hypothetical protein